MHDLGPIRVLGALQPGELLRFGGKAWYLDRLKRAGFLIPDGIAVGRDALTVLLRNPQTTRALGSLHSPETLNVEQLQTRLASAREGVMNSLVPATVSARIREVLKKFGSVAVRSSALGEDGFWRSSAGLYESRVDIRNEDEALFALKEVVASQFTPQILTYQRSQLDLSGSVAVVVQRMISPRIGGVLATIDPLGENEDVMEIEFSEHGAKSVVNGESDVVRITLERISGRLTSCRVGRSDLDHCQLGNKERLELFESARSIEQAFGFPVDLEWAYQNGHLFILQARPLTAVYDSLAR